MSRSSRASPETIPKAESAWRLAAAARNRWPRGTESARQALRPAPRGASPHALRRQCRRRKRGPEPKTATVERREASVPERRTRGACKRLVCRVMAGRTGAQRTRAPVGAPPTLVAGLARRSLSEGGSTHHLGTAPREEMGCANWLFEIVERENAAIRAMVHRASKNEERGVMQETSVNFPSSPRLPRSSVSLRPAVKKDGMPGTRPGMTVEV